MRIVERECRSPKHSFMNIYFNKKNHFLNSRTLNDEKNRVSKIRIINMKVLNDNIKDNKRM